MQAALTTPHHFTTKRTQAIADIADFNIMEENANAKILAYTNEQHQANIRDIQVKHELEVCNLLKKLTRQANDIDSLKYQNDNSAKCIASLTQLIGEKDEVRNG